MHQDKLVFVSAMLITCAVMCLFLAACKKEKSLQQAKPTLEKTSDHIVLDFQSLELVLQGSTNELNTYSIVKTDQGVCMENYLLSSYFCEEKQQEIENKYVCNSLQGSKATYHQLAKLLDTLQIKTWNSFKGSDNSTLDGSSFSFLCVLKDGTKITACGHNDTPKNFHILSNTLFNMINCRPISETNFQGHGYSCLLPQSWIGPIEAIFEPYHITFRSKINGQAINFLTIEDNYLEFPTNDNSCLKAGKLEASNRNDIYISIRKNQNIAAYIPKMDEAQKNVCQNLDYDIVKIIDSMQGTEGFKFIKSSTDRN
ncbi:MAG: hypothetical protein ACI38Q_09010 [Candidatus Bruticola sp.]